MPANQHLFVNGIKVGCTSHNAGGAWCPTWRELYPFELESSSRAIRMMVAPVKISFSAASVAVGGKLPTNTTLVFLLSERNNHSTTSAAYSKVQLDNNHLHIHVLPTLTTPSEQLHTVARAAAFSTWRPPKQMVDVSQIKYLALQQSMHFDSK